MKTIEDAARDFLGLNESNPNYTHTIKDEFELSIFKAGVEFAQRFIPIEEELPEIDESGESDLILMKIDHFVYVGNYTEDGEWVELITGEKYTPTHWRQIELK